VHEAAKVSKGVCHYYYKSLQFVFETY